MSDEEDLKLMVTSDESDESDEIDDSETRKFIAGELTKYAVDTLEYYSKRMPKNKALGITIEALSETLGNIISLVKEDNQLEVIESANLVIQQGLLTQTELVATLAYGQIGHC